MKTSGAKSLFIAGTVISSIIFLVLTYDSVMKMPQRTHEDRLDAVVADGKWVWQKYNCNDCHTILGIGGYYAPDVTKVAGYRDAGWLRRFLKDPENVWPAERKMPNLHLKDKEVADLVGFLAWVNEIDTNNWPPKPMVVSSGEMTTRSPRGEVSAVTGYVFGWTWGMPFLEQPPVMKIGIVIVALIFLFNIFMTMMKTKKWTVIQGMLLGGLAMLAGMFLFGIPFMKNLSTQYYWCPVEIDWREEGIGREVALCGGRTRPVYRYSGDGAPLLLDRNAEILALGGSGIQRP